MAPCSGVLALADQGCGNDAVTRESQHCCHSNEHRGHVPLLASLGHRRRREESIPVLHAKFKDALAQNFEASQSEKLSAWTSDAECFDSMPVHEFVELWQA